MTALLDPAGALAINRQAPFMLSTEHRRPLTIAPSMWEGEEGGGGGHMAIALFRAESGDLRRPDALQLRTFLGVMASQVVAVRVYCSQSAFLSGS